MESNRPQPVMAAICHFVPHQNLDVVSTGFSLMCEENNWFLRFHPYIGLLNGDELWIVNRRDVIFGRTAGEDFTV